MSALFYSQVLVALVLMVLVARDSLWQLLAEFVATVVAASGFLLLVDGPLQDALRGLIPLAVQ